VGEGAKAHLATLAAERVAEDPTMRAGLRYLKIQTTTIMPANLVGIGEPTQPTVADLD
jgi:hypothetical protein